MKLAKFLSMHEGKRCAVILEVGYVVAETKAAKCIIDQTFSTFRRLKRSLTRARLIPFVSDHLTDAIQIIHLMLRCSNALGGREAEHHSQHL